MNYSFLLMKEMIHHLAVSRDMQRVFKGVQAQLRDEGVVVVVTRPVCND